MARMSGFFCQDEYLPKLAKLTDEEVGSLMRALMKYHADGEIADLDGKVGIAFDFIRDDIDQQEQAYRKKCEQAAENRRKGISQKKTDDNARQRPSTDDNGRDKHNITITECNNNITELSSFMDDGEARKIQSEHDRLFDAAGDAGFKMSNTLRAQLLRLYSENGLDKMLNAIGECVRHGATNLAYLEAVLKGEPRKQKPKVIAQDYNQRSYDQVTDELMKDQIRDMEEFMKRNIG